MVPTLVGYSLVVILVVIVVFLLWQVICVFTLKIVNPVLTVFGSRVISERFCRSTSSLIDSLTNWLNNFDIHLPPLPTIDVNISPNMTLILLLFLLATMVMLTIALLKELFGKANFDFSDILDTIVGIFAGIGASSLFRGKGAKSNRQPEFRGLKPNSIFISYRRKDSADVVGRIYDNLTLHFGKAAIFKDVDSIHLGANFPEILKMAVLNCKVLLAVIGDRWFEKDPTTGKSFLENEDDYVRFEIKSALENNIPVIQLLVQGAVYPTADKLPANLKKLPNQNGLQIRPDPDFRHDMDRLIKDLEFIFKEKG